MKSENLSPKSINEFTPEDTIYIQVPQAGISPIMALCQFIKFEKNKISGKVLQVDSNPSLYIQKIEEGWVVEAPLIKCALYGPKQDMGHSMYHWFSPSGTAYRGENDAQAPTMPSEHPSYGLLSINKTQSSHNRPCFGSPIMHQNTVHLVLHGAEIHRVSHHDRIHAKNELLRLEMTPQQFADMLTSPNTSGTPVTIRRILGESMEATPFVSKLDQYQGELKDKIQSIHKTARDTTKDLAEIIEKSKLGKQEKIHMNRILGLLNQEIESNLPFLTDQMGEEMQKVVGEAKTAISHFLEEKAKELGIPQEALQQAPVLHLQNSPQESIE